MRTIEFRGRHLCGQWYYGNLIVRETDSPVPETAQAYKCVMIGDVEDGSAEEVEEETIGQFTGLCDKNNKEIYEGDIVAVYDEDDNKKGQGKVEFLEDWGVWYISATIDDGLFDVNYNYYIEVIGNVYDNEDLLKE